MEKKKSNKLIPIIGAIAFTAVIAFILVSSGLLVAHPVLLSEAPEYTDGSKIMVTANVADDSFSVEDGTLTFDLCDPINDPDMTLILPVSYKGDVPVVFGNGVKIICTGVMNDEGVLVCSSITINHPVEFDSAEGASSVADLLKKSDSMVGKTTKVTGVMQDGTLADISKDVRFVIADDAANGSTPAQLNVRYVGPLSDNMVPGASLVLTGALSDDGDFVAEDVKILR